MEADKAEVPTSFIEDMTERSGREPGFNEKSKRDGTLSLGCSQEEIESTVQNIVQQVTIEPRFSSREDTATLTETVEQIAEAQASVTSDSQVCQLQDAEESADVAVHCDENKSQQDAVSEKWNEVLSKIDNARQEA